MHQINTIKKKYFLLFLLSISTILLTNLGNYLLKIDDLNYKNLVEELSLKQAERFIEIQAQFGWIVYLLTPVIIFIKTIIIASAIYVGVFMYSKKPTKLNSILIIVLKAEFVFLIAMAIKILWFYFFETNFTLEDIKSFYPISAINIIGYEDIDSWLIYPLQTLNLFELAYIVYLSYQIGSLTSSNADNGLKIVAYTYIPALLLWVTIVMFLTLNYS